MLTDALCAVGWCVYLPIRVWLRTQLKHAQIKNILICNNVRGLGNLVLLSPLLLNVKKIYPLAQVTVLMPETPLARIVDGSELADRFIFYDIDHTNKWRMLKYGWDELRPQTFSLVLHTFFSGTLFVAFWFFVARCRYRIGYAQSQIRGFLNLYTFLDDGRHEIERHLRLIKVTGHDVERRLALHVTEKDRAYATKFFRRCGLTDGTPIVGVHPGSDRVNVLKRWDAGRFVEVINAVLEQERAKVLVFLGPDDMDLYEKFKVALKAGHQFVTGESINHVAAIIGKCRAFLSNDSGLMHLAAAMGLPITAIFGPTGTEKNMPLSPTVTIIQKDLECRPCYKGAPIICTQPRQYCLESIETDAVSKAVIKSLNFIEHISIEVRDHA